MWKKESGERKGCLYLCALPIGNLGDITLRVLSCLKEVDLIAAEDTRHTRKLLSHYNIKTPLFSYHQHSNPSKREELLSRIARGDSVALVSDAGLPALSDPGEELVREALCRHLPVTALPGPFSLLTALILSGFPTVPFTFLGFLEKKGPKRKKQLKELADGDKTAVFFESPYRILSTLKELAELIGERKIAVARELTKVYEEVVRGEISYVIERLSAKGLKGEFTLVVAPAQQEKQKPLVEERVSQLLRAGAELGILLAEGLAKKEAAYRVAARFNLSKKKLYQLSLQLDEDKIIPPSC